MGTSMAASTSELPATSIVGRPGLLEMRSAWRRSSRILLCRRLILSNPSRVTNSTPARISARTRSSTVTARPMLYGAGATAAARSELEIDERIRLTRCHYRNDKNHGGRHGYAPLRRCFLPDILLAVSLQAQVHHENERRYDRQEEQFRPVRRFPLQVTQTAEKDHRLMQRARPEEYPRQPDDAKQDRAR